MGIQTSFFLAPPAGLPALITPTAVTAALDWHLRHAVDERDPGTDDAERDFLLRASYLGLAVTDEALDPLIARCFDLDPRVLSLARRAAREGAVPLVATSAAEAVALDRLADFVLAPYDDAAPDAPLVPVCIAHAWSNLRMCSAALAPVAEQCGPRAAQLWSLLLTGRSVAGDAFPYVSIDPYHARGYWTHAEASELAAVLSGHFVIEPITVGPTPEHLYAIAAVEQALAVALPAGAGVITERG